MGANKLSLWNWVKKITGWLMFSAILWLVGCNWEKTKNILVDNWQNWNEDVTQWSEPSNTWIQLLPQLSEVWCSEISINIVWGDSINAVQVWGSEWKCLISNDDKKKIEELADSTLLYVWFGDKFAITTAKDFLWNILDIDTLKIALSQVFGENSDFMQPFDEEQLKKLTDWLWTIDSIKDISTEQLTNIVLEALSTIEWPSSIKIVDTETPIHYPITVSLPEWASSTFDFEEDIDEFIRENAIIKIGETVLDNSLFEIELDNLWNIFITTQLDYDIVSSYTWLEMPVSFSIEWLEQLDTELLTQVVQETRIETITWNEIIAWTEDNEITVTFNWDIVGWEIITWGLADYTILSIEWNQMVIWATPISSFESWEETILLQVDWYELEVGVVISEPDILAPVIDWSNETFTSTVWEAWEIRTLIASDEVDWSVTVTQNGTVDFDSVWTYTITHTATDSSWNSSTVIHTYVVEELPNRAPTSVDDLVSTAYETAITIPVTSNDSDPDGDTLTVTWILGTVSWWVAKIVGNNVVYTPDPSFIWTGSFSYTVDDWNGWTASAHVSVDVAEAENRTPVLTWYSVDLNDADITNSYTFDILWSATDSDWDVLSIIDPTIFVNSWDIILDPLIVDHDNWTITVSVSWWTGNAKLTVTVSDWKEGWTSTADFFIQNLDWE